MDFCSNSFIFSIFNAEWCPAAKRMPLELIDFNPSQFSKIFRIMQKRLKIFCHDQNSIYDVWEKPFNIALTSPHFPVNQHIGGREMLIIQIRIDYEHHVQSLISNGTCHEWICLTLLLGAEALCNYSFTQQNRGWS